MRLPLLFRNKASLSDEDLMCRVSSKDDDRAFDELYAALNEFYAGQVRV